MGGGKNGVNTKNVTVSEYIFFAHFVAFFSLRYEKGYIRLRQTYTAQHYYTHLGLNNEKYFKQYLKIFSDIRNIL